MSESDIKMAFNEYDRDATGRVSLEELVACLKRYGHTSDTARSVAREILLICDKTKDRKLNYDEFKDAFNRGMLP